MKPSCRWLLAAISLGTVIGLLPPAARGGTASPPRLLIGFASYRAHPGHPYLYFYEHDGVASGKPAGDMPRMGDHSDFEPQLTPDGRLCVYNFEDVGKASRLGIWSVPERKPVELAIPAESAIDMSPSLSADGRLCAFASSRRSAPSAWNVYLFDRTVKALVECPGLNSDDDDRMPSLSGDGRWLAFASSRPGGVGLQDIYLYDLREKRLEPVPGLNSASRETEPAISADGRWIAFISTRPQQPGKPAGTGNLDVYLYDRQAKSLVALPGLNTGGPDQSPALSPDGRYLAFVSERFGNAGARDLFLYDRQIGKLLPTPDLNSERDDVDPTLAYLPN